MSFDLFVVRHAAAFERDPARWPDDSQRPLTPEGESAFRVAARGLGKVAPSVATVLSSPFPRAWRTAEILHERAGWAEPRELESLEAGRDPEAALAALRGLEAEGRLAIVGHEPMLSELSGILVGGAQIELKKGGVVRLSVDHWERGGGTLRWLLTRKVLAGLDS